MKSSITAADVGWRAEGFVRRREPPIPLQKCGGAVSVASRPNLSLSLLASLDRAKQQGWPRLTTYMLLQKLCKPKIIAFEAVAGCKLEETGKFNRN